MNRTFEVRGAVVAALATVVFGAAGMPVRAEEPKGPAVVKDLITQDLANLPGKEALVLTVEYPPGGASRPHRHDAEVFVYVLEGSIIMQAQGQEAKTLKAGDTFHESPSDVHLVSANASKTQPAKFVVFMVKDKGKPATRPAEAK